MEGSGARAEERPLIDSLLDSLASPIRLKMLRGLARREMGYSELMESSGMRRDRDAGKFSYHLKKLLSAGLVEVDKRTRKYRITARGGLVLDHIERMERELGTSSMMIVRRSEHLMEPFDRRKITAALVREAKLTPRLASEVAALAEEKLSNLRVKYLTAPLIRELVNTILLDMGLEKYRHRLTRVGMPVYDVSRLLRKVEETGDYRVFLEEAAGAVAEEYLLLNMLPRRVAEAHISGRIDLYPMRGWLMGVFGRAYRLDSEEALESSVPMLTGDVLWVKKELHVEADAGVRGLSKLVTAILRELPDGRILSARLPEIEELWKILEDISQEARKRFRPMVAVRELSPEEVVRWDDKARRGGANPCYFIDEGLLSGGYLLEVEPGPSDLHAIGSVNAPATALESERNYDEALERIREAAALAAEALSKGLELLRKLYSKRGRKVVSVVAVCGLYETAKLLSGSSPAISAEARRLLKSILEAAREGIRKGARGMRVRLAARCPRSAAQRMMKADAYRFGMDEVEKVVRVGAGYSYVAVPPRERFRSLEDRLRLEAELAPLMDGGHAIILGGVKRGRALVKVLEMAEELEEANPKTLIRFE